jgi:hypothetical protein
MKQQGMKKAVQVQIIIEEKKRKDKNQVLIMKRLIKKSIQI